MNSPKMLENLSKIRYIYERESKGEINLSKFFDAVVNGFELDINRKQLQHILSNDLSINITQLDDRLFKVLCEALTYYMSVWPGWQRNSEYHGGELQGKEWLERFRQYLIFKSNFIIKNSVNYIEEDKPRLPTSDKETQTVIEGKKQIAPYALEIGGPPSVLNNIVFLDHGGNILIKQHMEKPWQNLSVHQFLNWPHVSVEVKLPDVSITRSNVHHFERFLALQGDKANYPEINHIIHVTKMSDVSESDFTPYSYKFFFYYFLQLNIVLQKIPNINQQRLNEIAVFFAEFLNDVKEIDLYNSTMSSHVTVGFNIGKSKYIRNKKMVSSSATETSMRSSVNFYEIIIPQVDLSLNYFKAVQDCNDINQITFTSLNTILTKLEEPSNDDIEKLKFLVNNSCVTYHCNLCKENFYGPNAHTMAIYHFKDLHKSEQSVLCYKCGKQFQILILADKRWTHKCTPKSS